ncbi:MAG: starch-binding outer membrane protein SusD/RagB family [Anaerophaga sp.]|nr:starch-binding outer membrane protein SusD/RagB family [Anaerophaga sp.]
MKTIKILSVFSLVLSLGVLSCSEDFLEQQPELSQTNELSLSTFDGIEKAITGAYTPLYESVWYGRDFVVIADLKGGNAKSSPMNSGRFRTEYLWSNTPTSTAGLWTEAYDFIARVNNVINALDGFEETNITQAQIDNLVGEAKFLRALAYHDLVRMYAQPYSQDPTSLGVPVVFVTENEQPARNTVAEVYQQIVADLTDAETKLSADNNHGGNDPKAWATKDAVKALFARVYLYMEDWQKAADYASEIINNEDYSLYTADQYSVYSSGENEDGVWGSLTSGDEDIFMIYGSEGNSSHGNWDVISYIMNPGGYGDVGASGDVLDLYEEGDVRGELFTNSTNFPNDFWTLKYPGKDGNLREDNINVLRLSEMYLIRAEAILNGASISGVSAVDDLNAIRENRGASALSSATLNTVYDERRRELCFEGHQLFDLSRTGRGLERNDYDGSLNQNIPFPDYRWAMPIPQTEMDANENMIQNPGYGEN